VAWVGAPRFSGVADASVAHQLEIDGRHCPNELRCSPVPIFAYTLEAPWIVTMLLWRTRASSRPS
jgi:hypothetical protein